MQLHLTRPGLVAPVPSDPTGVRGPTPGRARGRRWRTTSPGLFVPSEVDGAEVDQRIIEAVAGAPPGCGATGWAALHWHGGRWFGGRRADGGRLPVPIALGDTVHLSRREGVAWWHDWLFDDDLVEVDGLPVTRPERAVCAAALRARSLEDTVRVLSMAAADDLVSIAEVAGYATRIKGRPHTLRLRDAIGLADENQWSPMEVTLRMRWSGQRPHADLRCNAPVFGARGEHLLTPDLIDASAGVVGQYDGVVHEQTRVRTRDLHLEELCRDLGLEVVTMISTDLRDTDAFERRLAGAYRRASARDTGARSWTLEQPPWWQDTSTVALRRALTPDQRLRWLPHLRA